MPSPVLSEYRNQNSQRQYPFADDASMQDSTGQKLPVDFLIDATLYPIDIVGRPYLSKVDLGEGTLHFADSGTGTEIGTASFTINDTETYVYEPEYDRQIGVIAFGDGISTAFLGATVRVFVPTATPLAPTAFFPLNQPGVRGFRLPNGELVTGDVTFKGENGVVVTSTNTMEGIPILRIDIIGVDDSGLQCLDLCPPIKEICFERAKGSAIDISEYGEGTIALYGSGYDLNDICRNRSRRRLPDENGDLPPGPDPCDPIPPDPPEPYPDEDKQICFLIAEVGPYFLITNPSSVDESNPIAIKAFQQLGIADAPRLMQQRTVNAPSDLRDQIQAFTNPPFMADVISIGIRGIGRGR